MKLFQLRLRPFADELYGHVKVIYGAPFDERLRTERTQQTLQAEQYRRGQFDSGKESHLLFDRANVLAYLKPQRKAKPDEELYSSDRLVSSDRVRLATEAIGPQFFLRSTVGLARALLGCVLLHGESGGMIVETEAYLGEGDLAAHSSRGRTERTEVIFGPPGRAYVYFIYGMHECLNVVAEPEGTAGCVLIRALHPLCGLQKMYDRRRLTGPAVGLTNGPGKLTQALAITRRNYGQRLDEGKLVIREWQKKPAFDIAVTARIGITQCADWPLRFIWAGHPALSKRTPQ